MGYYEPADIPFQRALAEAFTLCDAHHCSVQTGTLANRVVFMTGDTMSVETQRFLTDTGRPVLTKPLSIDRVRAVVEDMLLSSR